MQVITTERIPIKSWVSDIEEGALTQAKNAANLPFACKWVALMPDCHQGYGVPIGCVLATNDVVIPNAVGVDIGCGMSAARLNISHVDAETIGAIRTDVLKVVPTGFSHHKTNQQWDGFDNAPDLPVVRRELDSACRQLGTLGGGNHFIEIQSGSDGHIWLMLHSGSRNFGLKIAQEYHKIAVALCNRWHSALQSTDLAFLPRDSEEGIAYFRAMCYALRFAAANRELMTARALTIIKAHTGADAEDVINIHHNYADLESHHGQNLYVHRKGATRARKGELGIIPGSMGTHSYIVRGLGNPESFTSCSHGAGRAMGRGAARRTLDLAAEQAKMDSVVHSLDHIQDLDEAPGAYKDISTVMANQSDLVEIVVELTPLGSIKG